MAKLPTYDAPTVQPERLPTPFVRMEGFATQQQTMWMITQGLYQGASALHQVAVRRRNETEAATKLEATNTFTDWADKERIKLEESKGKDAVVAEDQFNKNMDLITEQVASGIPDQQVREQWRRETVLSRLARSREASNYVSGQSDKYIADQWTQFKSDTQEEVLRIVRTYDTDPDGALPALARELNQRLRKGYDYAKGFGWKKEWVDDELDDMVSRALHASVLEFIATDKASVGRELYESAKEDIGQAHQADIETKLSQAETRELALGKVTEIFDDPRVTGDGFIPEDFIRDAYAAVRKEPDELQKAIMFDNVRARLGTHKDVKDATQDHHFMRIRKSVEDDPDPWSLKQDPWFDKIKDTQQNSILSYAAGVRGEFKVEQGLSSDRALYLRWDMVSEQDATGRWHEVRPRTIEEKAKVETVMEILPYIAAEDRPSVLREHQSAVAAVAKAKQQALDKTADPPIPTAIGGLLDRFEGKLAEYEAGLDKGQLLTFDEKLYARGQIRRRGEEVLAAGKTPEERKKLSPEQMDEIYARAFIDLYSRGGWSGKASKEPRIAALAEYEIYRDYDRKEASALMSELHVPYVELTEREIAIAEDYYRDVEEIENPTHKEIELLWGIESRWDSTRPLRRYLEEKTQTGLRVPDPVDRSLEGGAGGTFIDGAHRRGEQSGIPDRDRQWITEEILRDNPGANVTDELISLYYEEWNAYKNDDPAAGEIMDRSEALPAPGLPPDGPPVSMTELLRAKEGRNAAAMAGSGTAALSWLDSVSGLANAARGKARRDRVLANLEASGGSH